MKKKLTALLLVFVLCLAVCPISHAASNGDLTVYTYIPESTIVTFVDGVATRNTPFNITYYNCKHAMLPQDADFTDIMTIFSYTGTALKINGTTVSTNPDGNTKMYVRSSTDFTDVLTIDVLYAGGCKTYYVFAYPPEYTVKMSFEYENAREFANTNVNAQYGTNTNLDPVSSTQKAAATAAVSAMDTMCESMLPSVTAAQYRELDNIIIEPLSYNPESNNVYGLVGTFANARTCFTYTTSLDGSVILSIGSLYYNSTGTASGQGSGCWVYFIKRGTNTYCPLVNAQQFILLPGDEVIWRYTCDYGYDIGYPMW